MVLKPYGVARSIIERQRPHTLVELEDGKGDRVDRRVIGAAGEDRRKEPGQGHDAPFQVDLGGGEARQTQHPRR